MSAPLGDVTTEIFYHSPLTCETEVEIVCKLIEGGIHSIFTVTKNFYIQPVYGCWRQNKIQNSADQFKDAEKNK